MFAPAGAKKARTNGHAAAAAVAAPAGRPLPTAIVLDIEGTVASISYVTDVLFPYAQQRLRSHLEATFDSEETQADLDLLRQQVPFTKVDKMACSCELTPHWELP